MFAGALAVQVPESSSESSNEIWLGDGQDVTVTAHVISEGNLEAEAPGSWRQRMDVQAEQIDSESRTQRSSFGLRLSIYSKSSTRYDLGADSEIGSEEPLRIAGEVPGTRLFRYGERLRFVAKVNAPRNFGNPGAFDYVGYLRDQGIVATASTKVAAIEVLPGFFGSRVDRALSSAHRSILERIHSLWSQDDAALIDAMLIGERSFVERPVRVNFQRSGTYHMLIVAGLHVGILAGFVLWTLRRMHLGEVLASACSLITIFAYAELTRQGTPVWRAALMFAAYLITRLLCCWQARSVSGRLRPTPRFAPRYSR